MRQPYFKKSHKAWYVTVNGRSIRLGATEEEAKRSLDQKDNWTVPEIVAKFLDHHRRTSSAATCQYYQQLDALPFTMLASGLKPYHLTEWVEEKKLPSYYLRLAKSCFKWAEQQEYITQSPLRHLKAPAGTSRGDWAYLTADQWTALSRIAGDLGDLVITMRETGCRPQEIKKVASRHFDRAGRCWVFPKEESKGKKEQRVVHLSHRAFEICQRLALKYPEGSLFRNSKNGAWSTAALDGRFDRLSTKLKFHVTPYSLRHTFATDAIIRGVDLQTVATLMGHTSLRMLSTVYQHVRCRSDHIKEGLRRAVG
jgi:integrase